MQNYRVCSSFSVEHKSESKRARPRTQGGLGGDPAAPLDVGALLLVGGNSAAKEAQSRVRIVENNTFD